MHYTVVLTKQIHVDRYKLDVYNSLRVKDSINRYGSQFHMTAEAPNLVGFMCGNSSHKGILTSDERVRLHSCEKGNYCKTIEDAPVVWIEPIVAHLSDGQDLTEIGAGGGGQDLVKENELDMSDSEGFMLIIEA
jgi:DNA cross-link repair 1C protein